MGFRGLTRQIASEIAALSLSASENTRNKREEELRMLAQWKIMLQTTFLQSSNRRQA